jgi:phosphotransacetylase
MVLRHISSFGLQNYTSKCKDLTLLRRAIYMDNATNESILLGYGHYIKVLKFAQNIITVEKAKIIEGIDEDEIKARYDRFSKESSEIQVMDMEQLKEFIKNKKLE